MCDDWTTFEFCKLKDAPHIPGIYFLMNDVELVYIGQSKNIYFRILAHNRKYNCDTFYGNIPLYPDMFDSLFYFRCDYKPERRSYEDMFKEDYFPKLNGNEWDIGERIVLDFRQKELIDENKKREIEEMKYRGEFR